MFTPQSATWGNPTRPAYYAYSAANCTSAARFTILALGDGVDYAALALDPAGRPRLLLRVPAQSGLTFVFQYWACDSNCLARAHWTSGDIGYTYRRQVGWVEPFIRSFALNHLRRPRFVYYDAGADYEDPHWGAFYAYCDSTCTSAANWYETRLLDDSHASDFALAFSPTGQPRLVYGTYDSNTMVQQVAYAECNQNCHAAANCPGWCWPIDVAHGDLAHLDGRHHAEQAAPDQRDVGGFHGYVGAGANGEADVGPSQGVRSRAGAARGTRPRPAAPGVPELHACGVWLYPTPSAAERPRSAAP